MPSNFSRRSQRKTQTRLAFDPVEPSSSTTMSPARMRYQISSSPSKAFDLTSPSIITDDADSDPFPSGKKYAVVIETPKKQKQDGRLPFKPLGMADSSQVQRSIRNTAESFSGDPSDSDLEILPSFRRQRMHRSSVPAESPSLSRPSIGAHRFLSGKKKRRLVAYDGAGDDSSAGSSPEEEQATDKKTGTKGLKRKPVTLQSITLSDDDSGLESPLESPNRVLLKHGQAMLPKIKNQENTDETQSTDMRTLISGGSVNFAKKIKKSPRKWDGKKTSGTPKFSSWKDTRGKQSSSTRSEGEDAIAILPTPQRTGGRKKQIIITDDSEDHDVEIKTPRAQSSRALNTLDGGLNEDELSSPSIIKDFSGRYAIEAHAFGDDEAQRGDAAVRSSGKRRLRKRLENDSEEHDTDEDDEDPISSPLKRRRMTVEDGSDSDPFTSPRNRLRLRSVQQKGTEMNPGGQAKRVTRQQNQKKPHRTEREKKLELLKRQRAGEKIIDLTSSESDAVGPRHGIYDSDSDLQVLSEFEDEEKGEDEGIEEVRRSLLPSYQDENEDDFIIDDDDAYLGVPGHGLNEIPLEFTHHAHKPLKEHFKDAVEWMIQNKINPAFSRKDPVYSQAFRKLDLEVQGYANSIYSSAVWREAFTRALWARPVFLESTISPGDEHEGNKCDACGRSNHPASFEIQFSGNAYNKDTLEEIDNDHSDGEDNDTDSSNASVNSKGQKIPRTDVSWFVGRFCKANAQTAHSLIHWKHALNDWVVDRLKTDGHLAAPKLAEREDWNTNKRSKYANCIVDEWEEEGEIKALYRDFKINLDVARQGKQTRWSK